MKGFLVASCFVLVLCSCERVTFSDEEKDERTLQVTIDKFQLSESLIGTRTREGQSSAVITFAVFDTSGKKVYNEVQKQNEDGHFGEITMRLSSGEYTMVAVGSYMECDIQSVKEVCFDENLTDVFCAVSHVNVDDVYSSEIRMTMQRCVSQFSLICQDGVPDEVRQFRFLFSDGGQTLNPTTGLAKDERSYYIFVRPKTRESDSVSVFLFLPEREMRMSLTVDALDYENEVVKTRTFDGLNMGIGKHITATGRFFQVSQTMHFDFDDDWKTETVNY